MNVVINSITGFEDAFTTMYISKRTWTPELDREIRAVCSNVLNGSGTEVECKKFMEWLSLLLKIGKKHITLLRYIDISITTIGIHRGGQDDIDAHAKRFDNRIIRNSTRLATFDQDEFSDYYKDKVMTTDKMLSHLYIDLPQVVYELANGYFYDTCQLKAIMSDNEIEEKYKQIKAVWVKSVNGYIKEEYRDNKDVKRGLYMLGIPSNFISKVNLCEWSHIFKERNAGGGANPEVKEWAEGVMAKITEMFPLITRDFVLSVEN